MQKTLFIDHDSRSANFFRKILVFGQAVWQRQNLFAVVDMKPGLEIQSGQHRRKYIHKSHFGVIGHQVATAFCTKLSMALLGLLVFGHVLGTIRYLDCIWLPKAKSIHGRS